MNLTISYPHIIPTIVAKSIEAKVPANNAHISNCESNTRFHDVIVPILPI